MIPHVITDRTATLYIEGEAFTVDRSTEAFQKITPLLSVTDRDVTDEIKGILTSYDLNEDVLANPTVAARVSVSRRGVYFDGVMIHNELTRRILDIQQAGLPVEPWVRFMENVYANPAGYAQDELYLWLEKADLPITEDGHFLAYKKVKDNYTDIYTGKFDNSVGSVVELPGGRHVVDPDRNNTCSVGLHFCSKEYLPYFGASSGNRVVIVKINPADVVSIPSDYNNTKGRTWKYEVVGELVDESPQEKEWQPVVGYDGSDVFRFDPEGYDADGYDADGYDRDGYDADGYDEEGYDADGYDRDGYDEVGIDADGYDADGYDRDGYGGY